MRTVTKYIAEDGTEFEYEHECLLWEEMTAFRKTIPLTFTKQDYMVIRNFFKTVIRKEESE